MGSDYRLILPSKEDYDELFSCGFLTAEEAKGVPLIQESSYSSYIDSMRETDRIGPRESGYHFGRLKKEWDQNFNNGVNSFADNIIVSPFAGVRTIFFRSIYNSFSNRVPKQYNVTVMYRDIFSRVIGKTYNYESGRGKVVIDLGDPEEFYDNFINFIYKTYHFDASEDLTIRGISGEYFIFQKPSIKSSLMKIHCTCPFYRYYLSASNVDNGLDSSGVYPKYVRRTPPPLYGKGAPYEGPRIAGEVGFPYRNPYDVWGMCKHIYYFVFLLSKLGLVRESEYPKWDMFEDYGRAFDYYITELGEAELDRRGIERPSRMVNITDKTSTVSKKPNRSRVVPVPPKKIEIIKDRTPTVDKSGISPPPVVRAEKPKNVVELPKQTEPVEAPSDVVTIDDTTKKTKVTELPKVPDNQMSAVDRMRLWLRQKRMSQGEVNPEFSDEEKAAAKARADAEKAAEEERKAEKERRERARQLYLQKQKERKDLASIKKNVEKQKDVSKAQSVLSIDDKEQKKKTEPVHRPSRIVNIGDGTKEETPSDKKQKDSKVGKTKKATKVRVTVEPKKRTVKLKPKNVISDPRSVDLGNGGKKPTIEKPRKNKVVTGQDLATEVPKAVSQQPIPSIQPPPQLPPQLPPQSTPQQAQPQISNDTMRQILFKNRARKAGEGTAVDKLDYLNPLSGEVTPKLSSNYLPGETVPSLQKYKNILSRAPYLKQFIQDFRVRHSNSPFVSGANDEEILYFVYLNRDVPGMEWKYGGTYSILRSYIDVL